MTVLQVLIFVSNLMGSYRNYLLFDKFLKSVVVIRIFVEIVLSITINLYNIFLIYISMGSECYADSLILYITEIFMTMKTLLIVIGSIAYSDSYKLYHDNFQNINCRWKNDSSYVLFEKRLRLKSIITSVLLSVVMLLYLCVDNAPFSTNVWIIVTEKTHRLLIESRFMVELMVAYCIISGIHEFLRILNHSVRTVMQHNECPEHSQIFASEQDSCQISEIVNTWRELYQHNLACAKHISHCFCPLFTFALSTFMMQCVTTMYTVVGIIIRKNVKEYVRIYAMMIALIYRAVVYMSLFKAGQKIQNEFHSLNKGLASLSNSASSRFNKSELRQLKDFYRFVNTSPIIIQFAKLSLGMYLLPMMLSLAATYIVVMLQINHVL